MVFMVFLFLIDGALNEGYKQQYTEKLIVLSLSQLVEVGV